MGPKNFDFNTKITVTGGWNGKLVVRDRGGAIKGKRIDVWMGDKNHHQDALNFGKKSNCTIDF
jgi:3D (Asp-Asp-Asp) domain-containing protein